MDFYRFIGRFRWTWIERQIRGMDIMDHIENKKDNS